MSGRVSASHCDVFTTNREIHVQAHCRCHDARGDFLRCSSLRRKPRLPQAQSLRTQPRQEDPSRLPPPARVVASAASRLSLAYRLRRPPVVIEIC